MILEIALTFIVVTSGYALLLWLACRRVARHLQGNPDAVKQVAEHIFVPLFGRKTE